MRKIWSLPYDSSRLNVSLISDSLPLFDEICRRTMNFVYTCLNSDSEMIRSVVLNGVNGSRLSSPIGRNAVFCALRYNIPLRNIGATTSYLSSLNPTYQLISSFWLMSYVKLF